MSAERSRWEALSGEIMSGREASPSSLNHIKNRLLITLKGIAERKHCSRRVEGWLQAQKQGGRSVLLVATHSDAKDNWQRPAIRLNNLYHLRDGAVLSLMITLSERAPKGIRAYTVGLEGIARASGQRWYARIDLTEEPEGEGLCGHPLLHCHIGGMPDDAALSEVAGDGTEAREPATSSPTPKVRGFSPRVPLPWLLPWEALEWLLATAAPELEPPIVRRASGP
jgi:hypothetical protein